MEEKQGNFALQITHNGLGEVKEMDKKMDFGEDEHAGSPFN